jgi:hypothetical protein
VICVRFIEVGPEVLEAKRPDTTIGLIAAKRSEIEAAVSAHCFFRSVSNTA